MHHVLMWRGWNSSTSSPIESDTMWWELVLTYLSTLNKTCLFHILPLTHGECAYIRYVCGRPSAQHQMGRCSRGLSSLPKKKTSAVLSPHWMSFTIHSARKKPKTSPGTHHTQDITCLNCCPLEEHLDPWKQEQEN